MFLSHSSICLIFPGSQNLKASQQAYQGPSQNTTKSSQQVSCTSDAGYVFLV